MTRTNSIVAILAASMFFLIGIASAHAQDKLDQARIAFSNNEYLKAAELYKQVLAENPEDEKILLEAGDVYMELEYFDTARDYYQRAYNEDSRDGDINRKLGTAFSMLDMHDEALEKLRRSYKFDDESLESRLALGQAYLRMGDDSLGQAQVAILGAKKEFPDDPRVYVALGDLYFEQGVFQLSETNYEKALELDNALIEPRIRLGLAYRQMAIRESDPDLYSKALEQFNQVTGVAPSEPIPWRQKGEIYYLAQQYDSALASYERYKELRPDDPRADYLIALAASEAQYYSYAIEPAKRVLERDDDRSKRFHDEARQLIARGYYSKGQTAMNDGKEDSAQSYYRMSADAYDEIPDSALSVSDIRYAGFARLYTGDTARGLEMWASLIERKPDSCEAAYSLASYMYQQGEWEHFLNTSDRIAQACGADMFPSIPVRRGRSLIALKQYEPAIAELEAAIAGDSSRVDAYYWLAQALSSLDRYDSVIAFASAARRNVVPDSNTVQTLGFVYYYEGVAYFKTKQYEKAIASLSESIELYSKNAQAYLFLAVTYHTTKDKENACKYYQKTLQHDPENAFAKENIANLGC